MKVCVINIVYIGPGDEPARIIKCVDMREYINEYFDNL